MYTNIRSNLGTGVNTKLLLPRFPVSAAEIERLLGFAVSRFYGCQESSTTIVDLKAGINLTETGTPEYLKPVTGLTEAGARAVSGAVNGWFYAPSNDVAALPTTTSWLIASYYSWDGVPSVIDYVFGLMDVGDGTGFIVQGPREGGAPPGDSNRVMINDAVNNKIIQKAPPLASDKIARGTAMLYDSTDGNLYYFVTGTEVSITAMGAWNGLNAVNCAAPCLRIGQWPGLNGTGSTCRMAVWAHGVALDGQGVNLQALMRRVGWAF